MEVLFLQTTLPTVRHCFNSHVPHAKFFPIFCLCKGWWVCEGGGPLGRLPSELSITKMEEMLSCWGKGGWGGGLPLLPSSGFLPPQPRGEGGVVWVNFPLTFPSQKQRKCWAVSGRGRGTFVGSTWVPVLLWVNFPLTFPSQKQRKCWAVSGREVGWGGVPLLEVPVLLWVNFPLTFPSQKQRKCWAVWGGGGGASSSLGSSFLSPYCYCIKKKIKKRCNTTTGPSGIQTEDFFFKLNALGYLSTGVHRPAVSGQRCHKCNQFYEMLYAAFQGNPRWERDCSFFSETFPFIQVKKNKDQPQGSLNERFQMTFTMVSENKKSWRWSDSHSKEKKKGGGGGGEDKGAIFQYSFHSCDSTLAGKDPGHSAKSEAADYSQTHTHPT